MVRSGFQDDKKWIELKQRFKHKNDLTTGILCDTSIYIYINMYTLKYNNECFVTQEI